MQATTRTMFGSAAIDHIEVEGESRRTNVDRRGRPADDLDVRQLPST
jgi:hypothetical protein